MWPPPSFPTYFPSTVSVLGFLLVTLLLSNAIAAWIDRRRAQRIADKCVRLSEGDDSADKTLIPVSIIVGWLGAGKTTVLNRLLCEPQGRRLCVIENEAGAVSIDHNLLAGATSDATNGVASTVPPGGVVVLKNGCICCSSGSTGEELERVLDRLLSLQAERRAFDHVVIETSGMADPAPLVSAFFGSSLSRKYALDSVITVVDAKHIGRHLDGAGFLPRTAEAARQIAYADTVLLSKADLASHSERRAAVAAVGDVNPSARVVECSHGLVDTALLLGQQAFHVDRARALLLSNREAGDGGSVRASHARDICTVTLPLAGRVLPLDGLRRWLQHTVAAHWKDLFRIKGLVWVAPGPGQPARLFLIQGVHAELHAAFVDTGSHASDGSTVGPVRKGSASVESPSGCKNITAGTRSVNATTGTPIRRRARSATKKARSVSGSRGLPLIPLQAACGDPARCTGHDHSVEQPTGPSIEPAIVLIGRRLDRQALHDSLHAAVNPPAGR